MRPARPPGRHANPFAPDSLGDSIRIALFTGSSSGFLGSRHRVPCADLARDHLTDLLPGSQACGIGLVLKQFLVTQPPWPDPRQPPFPLIPPPASYCRQHPACRVPDHEISRETPTPIAVNPRCRAAGEQQAASQGPHRGRACGGGGLHLRRRLPPAGRSAQQATETPRKRPGTRSF